MEDKTAKWRTHITTWERLKPLARHNRRQQTSAEQVLWSAIRNGGINANRFRRQHAIDRFIADFFCARAKLVVEVDGPIHEKTQIEDRTREKHFRAQGLRVLRFRNNEVLSNLSDVVSAIALALDSPSPLTERGPGGEVCPL